MTSLTEQETKKAGKKTFTGKVVSTKCTKTILVLVETQHQDTRYKKIIKRRKKFMAHDEVGACQEGDVVLIEETRPMSKRKCFIFKEIIKRKEEVSQ